jgi:putative cardiolipin synthase
VPRDFSYPYITELRERGVRIVIITNSLASTNHVAVHSAYGPRRKGMLKAGAELYEIKVDEAPPLSRRGSEAERVTLHTKAIIIDGEVLFLGSLNLDPRSVEINTEIGLFINSSEAAADFRDIVFNNLNRYSYRLALDERDRLRWHYQYAGEERIYSGEPGAGFWRRFKAGFYGLLPLGSQL